MSNFVENIQATDAESCLEPDKILDVVERKISPEEITRRWAHIKRCPACNETFHIVLEMWSTAQESLAYEHAEESAYAREDSVTLESPVQASPVQPSQAPKSENPSNRVSDPSAAAYLAPASQATPKTNASFWSWLFASRTPRGLVFACIAGIAMAFGVGFGIAFAWRWKETVPPYQALTAQKLLVGKSQQEIVQLQQDLTVQKQIIAKSQQESLSLRLERDRLQKRLIAKDTQLKKEQQRLAYQQSKQNLNSNYSSQDRELALERQRYRRLLQERQSKQIALVEGVSSVAMGGDGENTPVWRLKVQNSATVVPNRHVRLTWSPMPGAKSYTVIVTTLDGNLLETSPVLNTTEWTPDLPDGVYNLFVETDTHHRSVGVRIVVESLANLSKAGEKPRR